MNKTSILVLAAVLGSLGWVSAAAAQNACEIAKKACADETRPGPYYQLVGMEPKPNSVVPEWTVTIGAGSAVLDMPNGKLECTWAPAAIDRIYAEGADVTLTAVATSTDNNSQGAFIQLTQGFGPNSELGPRNSFEARTPGAGTATDSQLLHLNPHLPNDFAKVGDRIYVDVGGCNAGGMTYAYEYRQ